MLKDPHRDFLVPRKGTANAYMLSGDSAKKSDFTAPESIIFQKMNDFEGPQVYDPGMWL